MTTHDPTTHAELAEALQASIGRLRQDVEARTDPVLGEVAHALELLLESVAHVHEHTLDNRARIAALEGRG